MRVDGHIRVCIEDMHSMCATYVYDEMICITLVIAINVVSLNGK